MPQLGQPAHGGFARLDADTLAKLATLQLRVRRVVEGAMAGLHRSPHRGSSIEFAEHKEYSPGDDLRRLDWKAFARFDRYFIREHEDETEFKAYLLVDRSGSMGYGMPLSKLDYGSVLAGALAHLLGRQRDQTGLISFGEDVSYIPPRANRGQGAALLDALASLKPAGPTRLEQAMLNLLEIAPRRSVVVLISDMFDADVATSTLLHQLRARGHQSVLMHLLHRDEVAFDFDRVMLFEGMEDSTKTLVDPAGVRRQYLRQMKRFCDDLKRTCLETGVTYRQVTTDEALDEVLIELLHQPLR